MNPKSYHTPPRPVSTRVRCPVCHEEVYSRAGIHPQCAVRQADPPKVKAKPPGAAGHSDQAVQPAEHAGAKVAVDPSATMTRGASGR